jgi:tetratricopeptide (TPR) repeat protein
LLRRIQDYVISAASDGGPTAVPAELLRDADELLGCLPTADRSDSEILHAVGLLGCIHHSAQLEVSDVGYRSVMGLLAEAVRRCESTDPAQLAHLVDLGTVGVDWYERRPVRTELEGAVDALRTAHAAGPVGRRASRSSFLLGLSHLIRDGGSAELAGEALEVLESACREVDDPATPTDRDDLAAAAVGLLSELRGAPDAHRDALCADVVALARRIMADSTPDDPRHPPRMVVLGAALGLRDDDGAAATEAVRLLCRAIPALRSGEPLRTLALNELGSRLFACGAAIPEDAVDDADTMLAGIAPGAADGDPDQCVLLVARVAGQRALLMRGDDGAAARLPELATALAAVLPPGPERERALTLIKLTGPEFGDQDERVRIRQTADVLRDRIADAPGQHPLLRMWLGDLADLLRVECARDREPATLHEAIDVHRRLLGLSAQPDVERTIGLAELLHQRFTNDRDPALLVEASELAHGLLRATPPDSPQHASARCTFSSAISMLAAADRTPELIDLAEAAGRALIRAGCPPESLPVAWNNLALALQLRHERSGSGLTEAIDAARRAVDLGPTTDEAGAERLTNLAQMLAVEGQVEEAVALVERAVAVYGDRPLPPGIAAARATVLSAAHTRFGNPTDLDRAIAQERELVRAATDQESRAVARGRLAAALRVRFGRTGDRATLDEAINHYRDALHDLPQRHRMRPVLQSNLVVALRQHALRTGDPDRLTEAVDAGRAMVAATGPTTPLSPTG